MIDTPQLPDLENLCTQIFSGVTRYRDRKTIEAKKDLFFREASKALFAAGLEGNAFGNDRINPHRSGLHRLRRRGLVSRHSGSPCAGLRKPDPAL